MCSRRMQNKCASAARDATAPRIILQACDECVVRKRMSAGFYIEHYRIIGRSPIIFQGGPCERRISFAIDPNEFVATHFPMRAYSASNNPCSRFAISYDRSERRGGGRDSEISLRTANTNVIIGRHVRDRMQIFAHVAVSPCLLVDPREAGIALLLTA